MRFDRISPSIDVERMRECHVVMVGGAVGLARDLVHSGLARITLVDFDRVDESNVSRQDFHARDVGHRKVDVVAANLRRINPQLEVEVMARDFCEIDQDEFDAAFGDADLIINSTDFFPAHARGNVEAHRLGKAGIWIGLYAAGRAGEIIYFIPGVTQACYRCVASSRYEAHRISTTSVQIPSAGATIVDLHLVDAVAGQIAIGILTRGAPNRFGTLIEKLGNRNLLQVKIDPEYRLGDRDIFAEHLGDGPANFSWTTIALPMERDPECEDCARWRTETEGES